MADNDKDASGQFKPPKATAPKPPPIKSKKAGNGAPKTKVAPAPKPGKPTVPPVKAAKPTPAPGKAPAAAAAKAKLPSPKAKRTPPPKRKRPVDPNRGNVVQPVAGEVHIEAGDFDEDGLTLAFPGAERGQIIERLSTTGTGVLEAYASEAKAAITAFHRELHGEEHRERIGRFHYEIARLYETVIGDLEAAQGHYQIALESAPDSLPVIVGARRVLLALGEYQAALDLFDRELRATPDRAAKATLMLAKARVLADRLDDAAQARKVIGAAAELAAGDPVALKALEAADWSLEAWDQLIRTYEREANAVGSDPRHRAALIVRRARLLETHRRDLDAAVEQFEQAYKADDTASGALNALKRLHHGRKGWRDVIRVLQIEAAAASNAEGRAGAMFRIGQLHADRLGNRKEGIRRPRSRGAGQPQPTLRPRCPVAPVRAGGPASRARHHAEPARTVVG